MKKTFCLLLALGLTMVVGFSAGFAEEMQSEPEAALSVAVEKTELTPATASEKTEASVAPALPAVKEEMSLTPVAQDKKEEAKKPGQEPSVQSAEPKAAPKALAAAPRKAKKKFDDEVLLIDDFNSGVRSNLLGGAMGEWSKDEYDDTQGCEIDFVERPRLGKKGGYSMQISYDVDSPNQAYNGIWVKLEGLDARDYEYLVFYVKAPNYPPYGTDSLKLELKNKKGETGIYKVKRIPKGAWREYKIPFKKFKGLKDLSELKELIIVFDDKSANPKEGIIFLEHLYLTKGEVRRP